MRNVLASLILCGMLATAQATTYTVDPSGLADYTTISAAVAAAVANDTVLVNAGTYTESVTLSNGIYLLAASSTRPIIKYDGTGTSKNAVVQYNGTSANTTIRGFDIDGTTADNMNTAAHGISNSMTIYSYGAFTIYVDDCLIHNFTTSGFEAQARFNNIITNCEIFDGKKTGIDLETSYHVDIHAEVTNCRIHDITDAVSYGDGGILCINNAALLLTGNTIYNTSQSAILLKTKVTGIIRNNIIFDNRNGIGYSSYTAQGVAHINNTIYNNTDKGIMVETSDVTSTFTNNIVYGNTTFDFS